MLILTRKRNQKVLLKKGDLEIGIIVLGVQGGQVRLGFDADPDVIIDREEISIKKKDSF
jgi:carbon storage regulator CsrA